MEALKSRDETVDMLPFVRGHDEERRRHVRFPGACVILVLAFVMTVFCAACLVFTLRSASQVSDLRERVEKLESNAKWRSTGDLHQLSSGHLEDGDLDDENGNSVEKFGDETIVRFDHEYSHRQKRQTNDKKKKHKVPAKTKVLPSAIHLNLDVRRPTEDELQMIENGEVVSLSFGELSKLGYRPKKEYHNGEHAYIYKAWKVADWAKGERDYHFNSSSGGVKIQRKGLYFIYSQILYHNSATRSSYVIMVDTEAFVKCMESVDAVMPDSQTSADSARYKTCYVGAARVLDKGQTVWIKDLYSRFVTTDSTANFFGLMKIADLEK